MSHTKEQIIYLEDCKADFFDALEKGDVKDCNAIIDSLGEQGYETEAMFLHRALNASKIAAVHEKFIDDVEAQEEEEEPGDVRDFFDRHYP